jgi:N-acetylglucosaminyldiphosphoundecaprenol N-acetyl-beta-D-mannosaminyltransferase
VGRARRQADVLGVRVDDVTMAEAVDLVAGWAAGVEPRLVVTPNPEFVMAARRDPGFADLLNGAALAVPDGVGLIWAARLLGEPLRATVPGVALVEALAPRAAALGHRWFLLGAREGVAAEAGRRLAARHPGLTIAGALAGDPDPAADEATRRAIRAALPVNLLLVAYGAPKQERWLDRNLAATGAAVGIGVGGAFDFLAGVSRRPPGWVQQAGLGWLFRLVMEPWRWRRQLALPRFAGLTLLTAVRQRFGTAHG